MSDINPLDVPGEQFILELLNPNPTSSKRKGAPIYRVSFEVSAEDHHRFMTAREGNLRIIGRMAVVPDTDEQPAYDAINGKPKKEKEPKGPYAYFWEYLHPKGKHGGRGFATIPGVFEAIEEKRKAHNEDVWTLLHRVFDVEGGTLATVGPDQVEARFPVDKHPPSLKLAIERAMNHQKEREAKVEYGNNGDGEGGQAEDQGEDQGDQAEALDYVE